MTRAVAIVKHLLETEDDEFGPEEIVVATSERDEVERDRKPWEIRHLVPEFFSRANNRMFGTRKKYFYKGNFVVTANRNTGSGGYSSTSYAVYKLVRHPDADWDLMYQGGFNDLGTVKEFVTAKRSNPKMSEEDFRKQFVGGHLM